MLFLNRVRCPAVLASVPAQLRHNSLLLPEAVIDRCPNLPRKKPRQLAGAFPLKARADHCERMRKLLVVAGLSLATRTKATQAKLLLNKQVEIKQKQFLVYTSMMSYCVTLQFNTFTQMIIFVMTNSTGGHHKNDFLGKYIKLLQHWAIG